MTAPTVIWSGGAQLAKVPAIRRWLQGELSAWGVTAEVIVDLSLAVTEVCTNIVRHGYGATTRENIEVRMEKHGSAIRVTIQDAAPVFVPYEVKPPSPEELAEGGYGLSLVYTLVDEVEHQALGRESGNRIILVKYDGPRP